LAHRGASPEARTATTYLCAYRLLCRMQVKPSNILLDVRGEARLADFGLARVAKQRASTDATVASFSAVCGTAAFLDPI
jgi:serine/threonine protein kinase